MRRFFQTLALLLFVPLSIQAYPELIEDGGFEGAGNYSAGSNVLEFFSHWRYVSLGGANSTISIVNDAHSGSRSARLISNNSSASPILDNDYQDIRPFVMPGHTYQVSFWAKTPNETVLHLSVPPYDVTDTYTGIPNVSLHPLTASWAQYSATATMPANANSCVVAFRIAGTGTVFIDDVSFKEVAAGPPAPPVIALPAGITTTRRPRIEWRGDDQTGFQAKVTNEQDFVLWDSSEIDGLTRFTIPDLDLPGDTNLFAHVRLENEYGWGDWNRLTCPFRVEINQADPGALYTYDLTYTRGEDPETAFTHAHLVSALQGIVNREAPNLQTRFIKAWWEPMNMDDYWLGEATREDGWLEQKTITPVNTILELVDLFEDDLNGVVVWDPNVPATSNLASTIAGVEDVLPVMYSDDPNSLYKMLVVNGPQLPVFIDLRGKFTGTGTIPDTIRTSTGSSKLDTYVWGIENYIKTGKCDVAYQGHYIDAFWLTNPDPGGDYQNHTMTNHDYFISKRGFFWDLNVWGHETPVDDPDQPLGSGLATLKEVLDESNKQLNYSQMIHVGGFTPWAFKYTNYPGAGGSHGGVDTEWELVRVLTAYNAYIDADALGLSGMANASLYQSMPLPERYSQSLPLTKQELRKLGYLDQADNIAKKSYLYHYIGDYDAAAWTTNTLPTYWDSPLRGSLYLPWAVSPTNARRAPHFFEMAYRTRTAHDTFAAGSSGAGYVNPNQLLPSRPPSYYGSAKGIFQSHCSEWYRRFDYQFSGFVIGGHAGSNTPEADALFRPFSGNGLVNLNYGARWPRLEGNMPVFYHANDLSRDNPDNAADVIATQGAERETQFLMYRTVLVEIDHFVQLNDRLESIYDNYAFTPVNEQTLSALGRHALGGDNDHQATYLFDTIPDELVAGRTVRAQIAVRNDGWSTWSASGLDAVELAIQWESGETQWIELPFDIPAGGAVVLTADLQIPDETGPNRLTYEMEGLSSGLFSLYDDSPWSNDVMIKEAPGSPSVWIVQ